jgi:hypothetical protein
MELVLLIAFCVMRKMAQETDFGMIKKNNIKMKKTLGTI